MHFYQCLRQTRTHPSQARYARSANGCVMERLRARAPLLSRLLAISIASLFTLGACNGASLPIGSPKAAQSASSITTEPTLREFNIKNPNLSVNYSLTFGPTGYLWFNAFGRPYLGRMGPHGSIIQRTLPRKRNAYGPEYADYVTRGPDGNIWFTDYLGKKIGVVNSGDGKIREYQPFDNYGFTFGITSGPRRHLFVVVAGFMYGYVAELDTQPRLVKDIRINGNYCWPNAIASGPYDTLWVANSANCPKVTRIDRNRKTVDYPVTASDGVWQIARGPDGNMWFTAAYNSENQPYIGKITMSGQITEYPIDSQADGIVAGPDGNMWFTQPWVGKIKSMSLDGKIVGDYTLPGAVDGSAPNFQVTDIVKSRDGNLWFAEGYRNKIGEFVFAPRSLRAQPALRR